MNPFVIVAITTLLFIWFYTRSTLWRYVVYPSGGKSRSMFIWDLLFWLTHSAGIFYRFYPTTWWNTPLGTFYGRAGYFFMGLCWLICLWGLCIDVMSLIVNFINKKEVASDEHFNPSRRLLPQKTLALGGLGLVSGTSMLGVYHGLTPKVYQVEIPLADKFPELSGMSITQISDIHIGPTLKGDFLERVVRDANALKSDLIVVTGDIVDGTLDQLRSEVEAFKKLRAPMGVFYCTGNHEYYWGGQQWVDFMKECHIEPLINEHRVLNYKGAPFYLAGVTDLKAETFMSEHKTNPAAALPKDLNDWCKIVLAHRPKSCYEVQKTGAHLQLSGHTHGGQGIPWKLVVGLVQPFLAGLYRYEGMWLYVNRGTGFWGPPVRAGIQSEITKIKIV